MLKQLQGEIFLRLSHFPSEIHQDIHALILGLLDDGYEG